MPTCYDRYMLNKLHRAESLNWLNSGTQCKVRAHNRKIKGLTLYRLSRLAAFSCLHTFNSFFFSHYPLHAFSVAPFLFVPLSCFLFRFYFVCSFFLRVDPFFLYFLLLFPSFYCLFPCLSFFLIPCLWFCSLFLLFPLFCCFFPPLSIFMFLFPSVCHFFLFLVPFFPLFFFSLFPSLCSFFRCCLGLFLLR